MVAPDGSPVELYLRLPPRGEAELVDRNIPAGAEIFELGSGVGRVTHELLRLGHSVVAVDESAAMLPHVQGATTVCAPIEELDLQRRFACVLLMSNLVNSPPAERRAFLETCAHHVDAEGVVLIERHEPGWRPGRSRSATFSSRSRTSGSNRRWFLRQFGTSLARVPGTTRSRRGSSTTTSSPQSSSRLASS